MVLNCIYESDVFELRGKGEPPIGDVTFSRVEIRWKTTGSRFPGMSNQNVKMTLQFLEYSTYSSMDVLFNVLLRR